MKDNKITSKILRELIDSSFNELNPLQNKDIPFQSLTSENKEKLLKELKEFKEGISNIKNPENSTEFLKESLNNHLNFIKNQNFFSDQKWNKFKDSINNPSNKIIDSNIEFEDFLKTGNIISKNKTEIKALILEKNKPLGDLGEITLNEIVDKGIEVLTPISDLYQKYPVELSGAFTSVSAFYMYKGVVKMYDKIAFKYSRDPKYTSIQELTEQRLMRSKEIRVFMLLGAPLIVGTLLAIKRYTIPTNININVNTVSDKVLDDNKDLVLTSGLFAFFRNKIPFWLRQVFIIIFSLICFDYLTESSGTKNIILNNIIYVKIFFMIGTFTSFMVICYYILTIYLYIMFSEKKLKIPTYLPLFILEWLNFIKELSK